MAEHSTAVRKLCFSGDMLLATDAVNQSIVARCHVAYGEDDVLDINEH
jgi:hypothetical protein